MGRITALQLVLSGPATPEEDAISTILHHCSVEESILAALSLAVNSEFPPPPLWMKVAIEGVHLQCQHPSLGLQLATSSATS